MDALSNDDRMWFHLLADDPNEILADADADATGADSLDQNSLDQTRRINSENWDTGPNGACARFQPQRTAEPWRAEFCQCGRNRSKH